MGEDHKAGDKPDPTAAPEFQRVLGNMLKTPPKPQSELRVGKRPKADLDNRSHSGDV